MREDDQTPAAILVVEDDGDIRDLVCEALRDEGFRIVVAADHAAALAMLAAVRFTLVLTDSLGASTVADRDRWAVLDRIRAAAGPAPTVRCTAHNPALFAGWRERGFADLLAKPFDLDALLDTVRRHLP